MAEFRPSGSDSDEDEASLTEAKLIAQEKFEWLTTHAVVSRSRTSATETAQPSRDLAYPGVEASSSQARTRLADATPTADRKMACPGSYRSASHYLRACAQYSLTPNGGALLGLSLGLDMLEVDGQLTNLEMVPLCAALLDAPFVKHLKLSHQPLQDTGAAVLALALPGCPWIEEVELVGCRITGSGVRSICRTLPKSGVRRLVLRGNLLRQHAALGNAALAMVTERAKSLTSLDLQTCGLSSQGMRMIKKSQWLRTDRGYEPCNVDFEGNFVLVEVLNSVTHGICALICLEAWRRLNGLIIRLCHFQSRMAVTLYIASMMAMFLGSTLYHSMFAVTDLSWFFKMIDHCAIYFLIAGTYTPVLVMGCRDTSTMEVMRGVNIWVTIYWSLVALGILMEHIFSPRTPSWYGKFILAMYVLLGFGGVPYIATCPLVMRADVMVWIELGGLTYVIGIVFFLLDRRYPAMHVVWHILVGLAAFFHFVAVWNLTHEVLSDPHRSCAGHSTWGWGYEVFADLVGDEPTPGPTPATNASFAQVQSVERQL